MSANLFFEKELMITRKNGEIAFMLLKHMLEHEKQPTKAVAILAKRDAPLINHLMTIADGPEITSHELQNLGNRILRNEITADTANPKELRAAYHWIKYTFFVEEYALSMATRAKFDRAAELLLVPPEKMRYFAKVILWEVLEYILSELPGSPPPQRGPAKQQHPPAGRKGKAA